MEKSDLPFALYCRVSSVEQQQNQTIEGQVYPAEDFAKRTGRELVKVYRDDGVNGDLPWEARPAARELLADARAGRIKAVGVYLFDRFSRRVLEGLLAARELHDAGVTLFSLLENYDITTPQGEYMFIASLNNAQMNKAMLKQRTSDGQRRKARAGGWLGGNKAAYGYKVEGKRNTARIVLDTSPVPEFGDDATRVSVAQWIYEQVGDNRRSCIAVTDELNARGVPGYYGTPWNGMSLARMLRNTVYKGIHQYGDEVQKKSALADLTAEVPPIVSPELWERTNQQIISNRRFSPKNRKKDYLLRGLIYCGDCGAAYTGQSYKLSEKTTSKTGKTDGIRYRCNSRCSRRVYAHLPECTGGFSISGEIEDIVWNQIVWWANNPLAVADILQGVSSEQKKQGSELPAKIERLQKNLDAKDKERSAVLSLFRKGRIDESLLDTQLDEIAVECKLLQEQLDSARDSERQEQTSIAAAENAAAQFAGLKKELDGGINLTWQQRRNIILHVVDRVTITSSHLEAVRHPGRGKPGGNNAEVKVKFKFDDSSLPQREGQINYIATLL